MHISQITRAAVAAAGLLLTPMLAQAQQGPGWFVPPGGGGGGGQAQTPPRPAAPRPQPQARPLQPTPPQQQQQAQGAEPEIQVPLPPVPDLPPLPRGAAPPAAVIGVLGVPDIMRVSTAAQQVERIIGERREKLNTDAQKEQAAWRDLQQALANQRSGLNADQVRTKERELQERITNAQRQFRDRNRIIQEATQYGLGQIERTLIAVIRQVAESRGMNLVLHRAQVALNINEFDITEQVAEQMNKILASVNMPPDGVSPVAAAQPPQGAQPAAAPGGTPGNAPTAQPAAQPATPPAATPPAAPPAAPPRR